MVKEDNFVDLRRYLQEPTKISSRAHEGTFVKLWDKHTWRAVPLLMVLFGTALQADFPKYRRKDRHSRLPLRCWPRGYSRATVLVLRLLIAGRQAWQ